MPSGIYKRTEQNRTGFKKGHPCFLTEESFKKISQKNTGKKRSPEFCQRMSKMRMGYNNPMYGKCGDKNPAWIDGRVANGKSNQFAHKLRKARIRGAAGSHTLIEWENLKKKFSYMCLCCKKTEPEIKLSEDHIIPISKGGDNSIKNIQPLCMFCNNSKHTKTIDYRFLIQENV